MRPFIATCFLSSQRLLEQYALNGFIEDNCRVLQYIFAEFHTRDPYKPDYIYKNVIQDFFGEKQLGHLICDSFEHLSDFFEFKSERVYVKYESFQRWQECILSVSPLMIITYSIYHQSNHSFRIAPLPLISSIFDKSALPSVFDPQLERMITREGLNEMHMHLNGATEPDFVWQDALANPSAFYNEFRKSFDNTNVNEQYLILGDLQQEDLYRLLIIARQLRDTMIGIVFEDKLSDNQESFTLDTYDIGKTLMYCDLVHPLRSLLPIEGFHSSWQYEAYFIYNVIGHIEHTESIYFTHLFYYYLLIYGFFHKLLVQQKSQVGFDQFQKITQNEIRELTEKRYANRYRQLQGMYDNSLSVLEGRFAPKESHGKLFKLLYSIREGYHKNHIIRKSFKLVLVPHFIKLPDNRKPENILTFRDLELRIKNRRMLDVLLDTLNHDEYKELIVGFDAAANELHASPEVFSPIFRKLRFLGYSNFTYHAGEDFVHLVSGMRMVYEAVEFLEMRSGNRIGHATALGIDPKLWVSRLYDSKLTIKKGEWLDNLVFIYALIQHNSAYFGLLGKLQSEIFKYFKEIYNYQKQIHIFEIIQAWEARKYDPRIALGWREPSIFEEFDSQEIDRFNTFDETVKEIYELYHSGECIKKYNKMIQVKPLESPFTIEILREIQNSMIKLVNDKNIALETLPTSNVRISYYKHYDEHHLMRWLGIVNSNSNELKPTVVVGSDDTGIFMTNLRNEYTHIYQTLRKKVNQQEALSLIEHLNKNSKAFTFNR